MQSIHEINAQLSISNVLPEVTQVKLRKVQQCVQMIQKKYGLKINELKGNFDENTNQFTIILFNGMHGCNTDNVDDINKDIIKLLSSFNPKVSKEGSCFSYWSDSHITLPYSKIDSVLKKLDCLEEKIIDFEELPRPIAKCL